MANEYKMQMKKCIHRVYIIQNEVLEILMRYCDSGKHTTTCKQKIAPHLNIVLMLKEQRHFRTTATVDHT